MPCIKIINSIKIYIYVDDHNPPHFDALYAEYEELIEIKTLKNYRGFLPKTQRKKVLKWAEKQRGFLMRKWIEYNPNK